MRHPTEGVLRRLLDEPAGVAEADREHVKTCPQCLDGVAAMRQDAALVEAALVSGEGARQVDVPAAWARLTSAGSQTRPKPATAPPRAGRLRAALRRPGIAAVAAAVVLAGAGTAAANEWLQIFQTKQVAPVSFNTSDLIALPDLSRYGEVKVTREADVHPVADAATAAAQTGLDVPQVSDLPRGVSGDPAYQVGGKVTATFTFSADRAASAAAETGTTLPPLPPGLDGSSVRLVAGPGVLEVWSRAEGVPSLVVGRAQAPTAFSSGVPFETVRDYLLSLPGLPENVAAQLRTFAGDGSTLPLPVPADEVATSSTEVNGVPATLLVARDRTMAAVVWVKEGVVTVVAGSLDTDEVRSIAGDLR